MHGRIILATAVLCLTAAVPCSAQQKQTGVRKITSVEGITEYRLDNGLKVLLFPDASKPSVTVNLTIFVGSRHEGYGEAGMAHLLEHMLFKGTPTHPKIPKVLQERGARFNGTTWVDRTNYYETLPASDENLEFAIRLEADRMVNSDIKGEDLKSEMTVVRNEFERGENMPAYVLAQRMMAVAFEWHNYGRTTIGNRADIERVPVENLRRFYRKHYQPDNAMLVVAGRFKPETALGIVRKYFGTMPRPERKLDKTYTEEPAQDGERFVTLRRVGDLAVAGVLYHIPAGPHPDYASIDVLESVLTAAPAGRLYKALVETKKAASVSGTAMSWHDPGVIRFMAEVTKGNDPQIVLESMLDVIEQVGKEPVSEADVQRAKQRLLKQWELASANSDRIAVQLSEWAAQGDWRLYFLYRDRVEKVTPESVQKVAATYLKRNNRTVGVYLPTEKPQRIAVPTTPNLAEMIGDYKGREAVAAGEAFDVSPKNIEARTTRQTLPNGLKVALLPKKTRGETVNLRLTLRYGDVRNLRGLTKAAEYLPMMMLRGTKKLSRQQLQDAQDKLRSRIGAGGSVGTASFTIQSKRDQLPKVLDLLRQVLREPVFPKKEFEVLKQQELAGLEQQRTNPDSIANNIVRRKISPFPKGDPQYVPTIDEEIARVKDLSLDDVRKLYQDYIGAQHGELTIVGDFDREATLQTVQAALSGWEGSRDYERLKRYVNPKLKGSSQAIITPDKANATYFAALTFPLRDDHPDYPALVIGNFILGSSGLSSRLGNRVRQKEGLSYSVFAGFSSRALDDRSAFYMYASCKPDNIEKLKTAMRDELQLLLKKGVTAEELAEAKKGYLQREQVSRTDDRRLAGTLEDTMSAERDMRYYADLEEKIQNLKREQIAAAMRKHIDPKRLNVVTVGDFKKKSATEKKATEKKAD